MINNELLAFIKDRLAQNSTKEQITDMLVTHGGWDAKDVEEAFDTMDIAGKSMQSAMSALQKKEASAVTPVVSSEPEIKKPISIAPTTSGPLSGFSPFGAKKPESEIKTQTPAQSEISNVAVSSPGISSASVVAPISITSKNPSPASATAVSSPVVAHSAPSSNSPLVTPVISPSASATPVFTAPSVAPVVSSPVVKPLVSPATKTLEASPSAVTSSVFTPVFHSVAPAVNVVPTPKTSTVSAPASSSHEVQGFSAMTMLQQKSKILESTQTPSPVSSGLGTTQQKPAMVPTSLNSLRDTGRGSNASAQGPSSLPKLASFSASPKMEMSPHIQSGMTPTPGAMASSPTPFVSSKPLEQSRGMAAFSSGQKLPGVTVQTPGMNQTYARAKSVEPAKGRKLLATIMLLLGFVIGATGMHAYLSGYLDPAVTWVKTNIPALSQINL